MLASEQIKKLEQQLAAAREGVEEIDALNALAWELRERDPNRAQGLAEQALDLSRTPQNGNKIIPLGAALALITLGELANNSNGYGLALTRLLEAYTLLQDLPAPELLAEASHTIGWSHYKLGNFAEASDYLEKALKIFRELGIPDKEAAVLSSFGTLYNGQGEHARALETFEKARALQENQGDTRSRAVTLNNLALAQIMVGEYEGALFNSQTSQKIIRKLGLPSLEVTVLDTIGQVYLASGDTANAESTFLTCIDLAQRIEMEHIELEATLNLGKVYLQQGRLDLAREHFTQAVSMAEWRRLEAYRSKYHEMLTSIYETQGDIEKALFHYKEFHTAMENVLAESARYRLENLKILHQVEKTRKEAEVLWLQNRALEQEIDDRRRQHAELEVLATTDPLTSLYNRRHFFTLGEYEMEKSRQAGGSFSLVFLDIDHFKLVNDNYGHATGDLVLNGIAKLLADNARKGDVCCRIGGEEFVILLPDTRLANAHEVAERIRQAVFSDPIHIGEVVISVTASLGVVQAGPDDQDLTDVLARADEALFRAKTAGRNRVST